jgi:hypothetical protein
VATEFKPELPSFGPSYLANANTYSLYRKVTLFLASNNFENIIIAQIKNN